MGNAADHKLESINGEVFNDEVDAIIARREAVARRPDPCRPTDEDDQGDTSDEPSHDEPRDNELGDDEPCPDQPRPEGSAAALKAAREQQLTSGGSAEKPFPAASYGLVGFAISGGGIRSATFNLGIVQVFAKRGLLRWFDYLSTVSGGGYIGSALSSTLKFETEGPGKEKAAFGESFVHSVGKDEPEILKHLRSGRNYLAPGGILDVVRIPALLLRGIIINLLVMAPLMGLLALASAIVPPFGIFFSPLEFTGFSAEQLGRGDVILEHPAVFFAPTLAFAALFLVWAFLFPLVAGRFHSAKWQRRNRYELSFSTLMLAIAGVGVLNLLPFLYFIVFNGSFDTPPWRVGLTAIAAVVPVATSLRAATARSPELNPLVDKLKLLAVALLGPLILLTMYLGLTRLLLEPATEPFGEPSSALNVAARALRGDPLKRAGNDAQPRRGDDFKELYGELDMTIGEVMGEGSVYAGWVRQLYGRAPRRCRTSRDRRFHDFLACALEGAARPLPAGRNPSFNQAQELAQSLFEYQRRFALALWIRTSSFGEALFAWRPENRLVTLFAEKNLESKNSSVTYEEITGEKSGEEGNSLAGLRSLAVASEILRKDLVIVHSGILLLTMFGVFMYGTVFVNVNKTGLHRFYRDRLSKAYLYDPRDPKGANGRADGLKLSELHPGKTGAPYHLINAALNIPDTDIQDLQGRASDFFMMSPLWCGSAATGYAKTSEFEGADGWDEDLNLGSALAISGAAAAPQMGANTSRSLALILTLLNIRLDYWIPNSKIYRRRELLWKRRPGPFFLLREITGKMNVRSTYVNLSDGGHIENLGLYELLRRRCKYLVVCDAEQDPDIILASLGKLTAYSRMDEGIWIDWGDTLEQLKKDPETGLSRRHWAFGTIHYGAAAVDHDHDSGKSLSESGTRRLTVTGETADPEQTGQILYIKSSWCGKEWADMAAYKAKNPDFPQQSTGDQFFDEEQFEAYRALGYFIASQLFEGDVEHVGSIEDWFHRLEKVATPIDRACDELREQLEKLPRVMGVERGIRQAKEDGETTQTSYIRVLALAGKAGGDVPDQWRGREVVVETYVPSPEVAGDESAPAGGSPEV